MLAAAERLLPAKPVFVIDMFDTFLPKKKRPPELTKDDIRVGFEAFLRHYSSKTIVTYSDALTAKQSREWLEYLGLSSHIHACYGSESLFDNHVVMEGQDFGRLARDLRVSLDDVVIIADGASERNVSTWYHIDLIRVPPISLDFPIPFSFEELVF